MFSYKTVGKNVREARIKAGLTQEKAAEKIGISVLHWGRLERGERRIRLDQLEEVADALNTKMSVLLSGCILDDDFDENTDIEDVQFGQVMVQIARKCSPKTRGLMIKICKNIAETEKN